MCECIYIVNLPMCNKNLDFKMILHFNHPTTRGATEPGKGDRMAVIPGKKVHFWTCIQPLERKSGLIVKIWRREVRTALPA